MSKWNLNHFKLRICFYINNCEEIYRTMVKTDHSRTINNRQQLFMMHEWNNFVCFIKLQNELKIKYEKNEILSNKIETKCLSNSSNKDK